MAEPEGKLVSLLLRKPTTNGTPLPEHALVLMTSRLAQRCKARAPGAAVIGISDRRQKIEDAGVRKLPWGDTQVMR